MLKLYIDANNQIAKTEVVEYREVFIEGFEIGDNVVVDSLTGDFSTFKESSQAIERRNELLLKKKCNHFEEQELKYLMSK